MEDKNLLIQTQQKLISVEGALEGEIKRSNRLTRRINNLEEAKKSKGFLSKLVEKLPSETIVIVLIMGVIGVILCGTLFTVGLEQVGIAMGYLDMFITLVIIWVRDKMNDKTTKELKEQNNNLQRELQDTNKILVSYITGDKKKHEE